MIAEGGSPTKICGGVCAPISTLRDVLVLDSGYAFSSEATRYLREGGKCSMAKPEVIFPKEATRRERRRMECKDVSGEEGDWQRRSLY